VIEVEITRSQRIYDGFLKLDQAFLRHQTPDGQMSQELMRLNVERGDGAGALVVNRDAGTVVLTRQFRYANWKRGDGGRILEIPAGVVPLDQSPEEIARNELVEEAGYRAADLQFMLMFYASPGTSTERVYLYYAEVTDDHKVSDGGGLAAEDEYIEVVEMPVGEVLALLEKGRMTDAKTIIALQWFRQRERVAINHQPSGISD
jgi:ADP-ribose pyrophosphatase